MEDYQAIYTQYFEDVYKYLLTLCRDPVLAEEITQETFFKALKALDSFRGQCRLYVWLCQIAKNTYFTYLKKHREPENQALRTDSPEEGLLQKESAFAIHQILHTLPEPYKEVFSLRIFGQLSFGDIGRIFGRTANWACVTYHRACQKIQAEMEE